MPWTLTARTGPQVRREVFDELSDALDALERAARDAVGGATHEPVNAQIRRFEPAQIVATRIEVSGPERRFATRCGGVDVHRDGSVTAFTGRFRRQAVDTAKRQTPYAALRKALER